MGRELTAAQIIKLVIICGTRPHLRAQHVAYDVAVCCLIKSSHGLQCPGTSGAM
jgi:hypothetical protein